MTLATPEFTPRQILHLLTPSVLAFQNRRRLAGKGEFLRFTLFGGITVLFSLGIFAGFYRMLWYIGRFSEFTAPLTHQVLATVSVFLFAVLLASNVVTAHSTQYVSADLALLASSPVSLPALYASRLVLTLVQSSWMVLVFSLPMYIAFALTSPTPLWFLLAVVLVLLPLLAIPAALGTMITSALMFIFPARRVRELLMMIGALFVALLVFLIRTQQPERLLNPSSIYDISEFFSAFRAPASPLLPSTWATEVLATARQGDALPWFVLFLLWSTAAAMIVLGCWQARALYRQGYSRAQEAQPARFTAAPMLDRLLELATRPLELRFRSLLLKDLKSFLRDPTQWSQLFLLLALVVVYLYNFSVLPSNFTFATFFLQNLFSFLNLGLAGFVLSAVAVRFVFTAVSIEGQAFWIIRSSPLSLRRFLWSKFWTALPPLLVLSQILTLASPPIVAAVSVEQVLDRTTSPPRAISDPDAGIEPLSRCVAIHDHPRLGDHSFRLLRHRRIGRGDGCHVSSFPLREHHSNSREQWRPSLHDRDDFLHCPGVVLRSAARLFLLVRTVSGRAAQPTVARCPPGTRSSGTSQSSGGRAPHSLGTTAAGSARALTLGRGSRRAGRRFSSTRPAGHPSGCRPRKPGRRSCNSGGYRRARGWY